MPYFRAAIYNNQREFSLLIFSELIESLISGSKKRQRIVSIETRMAIHVAALRAEWENPGSYKEFTRRALEQEQIAEQKSTIDSPLDRAVTFEQNLRPNTISISCHLKNIVANERSSRATQSGVSLGGSLNVDPAKKSLRQRLEIVEDAWQDFQGSRSRDAIYPFLQRVYSLVERYERRGRGKRLMRDILKLTGFKAEADTNVYSLVIRFAAGPDDVDRKVASKLSRVLRYAAKFKPSRVSLRAFIRARGGLNGVAALYAQRLGRHRDR